MTRVRGPKNGEVLKSLFNGKEKKLFPDLKQTNALILISIVGNEYCTGEYLNSIVEEACNSHKKATFLIADEVYWNNLKKTEAVSFSEKEELINQAMAIGNDFLESNMSCFFNILGIKKDDFNLQYKHLSTNQKLDVINRISIENGFNFEVVRWHEWVNNPESGYLNVRYDIEDYYNSAPELMVSIEKTAVDFSRRHKKDGDDQLWLMRSRSYLKEESPAVMWLSAKLNYQFICYPGDIIEPFIATKKFFIHQKKSGELPDHMEIIAEDSRVNWLSIYFARSHLKEQLIVDSVINRSVPSIPSVAASFFHDVIERKPIITEEFIHNLTHEVFLNPTFDMVQKMDLMVALLDHLRKSINGVKTDIVDSFEPNSLLLRNSEEPNSEEPNFSS